MTRNEFVALVEESLEVDAGTASEGDRLADLGWSSLARLSFIALVDERCGVTLSAQDVAACHTVADLGRLLGDRLQ